MTTSTLRPSVITSSSHLPLGSLVRCLEQFPDAQFDLFVLRDPDLRDLQSQLKLTGDKLSVETVLEMQGSIESICDWVGEHATTLMRAPNRIMTVPPVGALATYFPLISSRDANEIKSVVSSMVGCIKLAVRLKEKGHSDIPVIEIVCGSRVSFCKCDRCKADGNRGFILPERDAIAQVLDVLLQVVEIAEQDRAVKKSEWALALEFEPGGLYSLGSAEALTSLFAALQVDKYKSLKNRVGINVDVGHMRIAKIPAQFFEEENRSNLIVHSHICDNPGMHTRDMPMGMWTPIDGSATFDIEYLSLFEKARETVSSRPNGLPFSGSVALELEGCSRVQWIVQGVAGLRHLLGNLP